ncbi:MAG TPA: hypothetical protein VFM17_05170 [Candidatus Eisenbacteria bacterium]|nr:hypothetical protein [Candidatus Eisenbacteria bacterium]
MMRLHGWKRWVSVLSVASVAFSGCAAVNEFAALRQVEFRYDGLADPEIVGIPISKITSYDQLSIVDVGRLALAVAAKDVPLDLTVRLEGRNPETNKTTARLMKLDWTYLVDDQEVVSGQLAREIVFAPGTPQTLPLDVRFNLVDFFGNDGKALFDTALILSGQRTSTKKVALRLAPTIETSLGPIRYPVPITLDLAARP